MKKKLIISVLTFILVSAAGFTVAANIPTKPQKPSEHKIGITYEAAVAAEKPMLAFFYVDWCTYCVKFMPKYKLLYSAYKNKYNFVMINVEDSKYAKFAMNYNIGGFPTLYILDPKYDNVVHLNSTIYADTGKLKAEMDRYLRIRTLLDSTK